VAGERRDGRAPRLRRPGAVGARGLGASSKLNARMDFLLHLKAIGRKVADRWISIHFDAIGQRSTIDVKRCFL
jgi:NTE family protein